MSVPPTKVAVDRDAIRVFRAVSDPTRRMILDRLGAGELSVNQIADAFPVSRPAISRHLRVLRRACLVREQRDGRRRIYRIDPTPLRHVDLWLARYRLFWAGKLVDLKEFVEGSADQV